MYVSIRSVGVQLRRTHACTYIYVRTHVRVRARNEGRDDRCSGTYLPSSGWAVLSVPLYPSVILFLRLRSQIMLVSGAVWVQIVIASRDHRSTIAVAALSLAARIVY